MRTVIHTRAGRLGQARGGYILHMSSEENTTVMQGSLVALKRRMNACMPAKHNTGIDKRPVHFSDCACVHPSTD